MRDLKSDLEICNKATSGPWKPFRDTWEPAIYTKLEDGCRGVCIARLEGLHGERQRNDANFIAAARTGWPEAIERAIKAEEEFEKEKKYCVEMAEAHLKIINNNIQAKKQAYEKLAILQKENDQQRHSIQQLSAQVMELQALNKQLLEYIAPIDGCDCEGCIEAKEVIEKYGLPDPGADLLAKIAKLEAVEKEAREIFSGCFPDEDGVVKCEGRSCDSEICEKCSAYALVNAIAALEVDSHR